jgi:phage terminase small subunit
MSNKLSAQQKRFADGVLSGLPAGRAYEAAGYKSRGDTADSAASQLLRNIKVSEYIENIKTKATNSLIISVTRRKEILSEQAERNDDETAADSRQAIAELNRMEGSYAAEKVEIGVQGGVLLVPMAKNLEEWEQASIPSQEQLQADTIDI